MNRLICFIAAFALTISASAQKDSLFYYPRAISISPLMIFPPDVTLMGGYEHRIHPKSSVVLDAGLIFASSYYGFGKKALGYHLRPSLRFYTNKRNNFYVGPQFMFKSVTHYISDWVFVNNSYSELKTFRYRRNVWGVNIITGVTLPAFHNSMFFDIYAGLGLRTRKSFVAGNENFTYNNSDDPFFGADLDGEVLPSLPIGLRLIFPLKN